MTPINQADTAWMLIATAMVLMMTPALGFFYGGLVRAKNTLNTMMMSYVALGFVGIAWSFIGYSLAFSTGSSWLGGLDNAFFNGVGLEAKGSIPHILFAAYQATFCVITAALISGAIVERMRFGPYVAFITLWSILVYAPIAHWVWGGGWLSTLGALDFAGGTVVHINAAAAALVVAVGTGRSEGLRAAGDHSAERALHAARRRSSLVRVVRLQRRERARGERVGGARVHQHNARTNGDTGGVEPAGHHAHEEDDRGRSGDSHRGRTGRDHSRGGFRRSAIRNRDWRDRRGSELLHALSGEPVPGSMTRST